MLKQAISICKKMVSNFILVAKCWKTPKAFATKRINILRKTKEKKPVIVNQKILGLDYFGTFRNDIFMYCLQTITSQSEYIWSNTPFWSIICLFEKGKLELIRSTDSWGMPSFKSVQILIADHLYWFPTACRLLHQFCRQS
jgi:hypothetical protein